MGRYVYELLYLASSPFSQSISLLSLLKVQELATLSKDVCLGMKRKETLDKVTQLEKLVLVSFFSLFYHSLKDKFRQVKISEHV